MKIVANNGKSLNEELSFQIKKIVDNMADSDVAEAVAGEIKNHFAMKYPGSKHYDPNKVTVVDDEIRIDVPGINRAYHDIDIYPINKQWLCIPLEAAKGQSPYDIEGLFKPKGHNVLMKEVGGMLTPFFALSKHVHQNQDSTLMPTDDEMFDTMIDQIFENL